MYVERIYYITELGNLIGSEARRDGASKIFYFIFYFYCEFMLLL